MQNVTPVAIAALVLELAPAGVWICRRARRTRRPALAGCRKACRASAVRCALRDGFKGARDLSLAVVLAIPFASCGDCVAADRGRSGRSHAARQLARLADSAGSGIRGGFALVRPRVAKRASGSERIASSGCGTVWVSGDPATERDWFRFPLEVERLENWPAGAGFLHAHRSGAGTGAGLHPSASKPARNRQRALALGRDIFPYRRAGRALLSSVGAELAGAAGEPACSSSNRVGVVRAVALQQTVGFFQLALCVAREHCGNFLRPRAAGTAARAGFCDYARQRGLGLEIVVLEAKVRPI